MKKLSHEEIQIRIEESRKITGYTYVFTGSEKQTDKILVKCPVHNTEHWQKREDVFKARKLACCNKFSPLTTIEIDEIIKKYNIYSHICVKVTGQYTGDSTLVTVTCSKHNISRTIKLSSLVHKKTDIACSKCSHEKFNRNHGYSAEEWAKKAIAVHGDLYDYSKMEDTGLHRTIICKKHGGFIQNIHNHVYLANGCPKCVVVQPASSYEEELNEYIKGLGFIEGIDYDRNNRSIIHPLEVDFYFKNLSVAIEFNGDYWHSDSQKSKTYHQEKKLIGYEKGVNIIMVYEHVWKTQKDVIKNRLRHILKKNTVKIYARQTHVQNVDSKTAKEFCNKFHIQGYAPSSINYGLYTNDTKNLVALMTFGKSRFTDHDFELIRYVTEGTIIGGAGKLFNHFKNNTQFSSVISYADLDWSIGGVYEKIGFTKIGITKPSYIWTNGTDVMSRYQTQIDNEDSVMLGKGFLKIYKCGNFKYEYISGS